MEREETNYLTAPQVTRILGLKNAYTVRRWIKTGVLEAEKVIEGKHHRRKVNKYNICLYLFTFLFVLSYVFCHSDT